MGALAPKPPRLRSKLDPRGAMAIASARQARYTLISAKALETKLSYRGIDPRAHGDFFNKMPRRRRRYGLKHIGRMPSRLRGFYRKAGYYGRYNRSSRNGKELKFRDTLRNPQVVTLTGLIEPISLVPQNTTETGRIGRKITLRSIHVQGTITQATSAAGNVTSNQIKLWVVLDTQTNGAEFVFADFLETADIDSFRNLSNRGRFRVLASKNMQFNAQAGENADFGQVQRPLSFNISKNCPIEYSGVLGLITEVKTNNIYVIAIARNVTPAISWEFNTRIRFTG